MDEYDRSKGIGSCCGMPWQQRKHSWTEARWLSRLGAELYSLQSHNFHSHLSFVGFLIDLARMVPFLKPSALRI